MSISANPGNSFTVMTEAFGTALRGTTDACTVEKHRSPETGEVRAPEDRDTEGSGSESGRRGDAQEEDGSREVKTPDEADEKGDDAHRREPQGTEEQARDCCGRCDQAVMKSRRHPVRNARYLSLTCVYGPRRDVEARLRAAAGGYRPARTSCLYV